MGSQGPLPVTYPFLCEVTPTRSPRNEGAQDEVSCGRKLVVRASVLEQPVPVSNSLD